MFMQQFCGINVIAYYSTQVFVDSGFDEISALGASLGFGIINVGLFSMSLRAFNYSLAERY